MVTMLAGLTTSSFASRHVLILHSVCCIAHLNIGQLHELSSRIAPPAKGMLFLRVGFHVQSTQATIPQCSATRTEPLKQETTWPSQTHCLCMHELKIDA